MGPYPPLRLYRFPFSTNVERVALALAHNGLKVESAWVDPADRAEVVRISGQGVADSTAILEHLEERFPERPLYPADAAPRLDLRPHFGADSGSRASSRSSKSARKSSPVVSTSSYRGRRGGSCTIRTSLSRLP